MMLTKIPSILGLAPSTTALIKYGLISAGIVGAILFTYHKGQQSAEAKFLREQLRVENALKEHRRVFDERMAKLQIKEQELKEKEILLDERAKQDPTSTNECIGPDGVRRLNENNGD